MKFAALALTVASGAVLSLPAQASDELAKKYMCLTCHTVDKKLVGPSYHDIAVKYKGDKGAEEKIYEWVKPYAIRYSLEECVDMPPCRRPPGRTPASTAS